ncbi:PH domain-containing protein [Candidatus Micrarchaeota archaeon]|nr:PH domain-containing protein [Candidatus Micrarchaeota archaeon]
MLIRENVPLARKLDSKIRIRWYVEKTILLIPGIVFLFALTYFLPSEYQGYVQLSIFIGGIIVLTIPLVMAELHYQKFVYALREKDFLIQKGIIEKIRYVIPYEKIQDVTVSRDLVDVLLGLGTLNIETAALKGIKNEISLPGISNDASLVSEIIEKIQDARNGQKVEKEYMPKMEAELEKIVRELQEIKESIKGGTQTVEPTVIDSIQINPITEQLRKVESKWKHVPAKKRK